MKTLPLSSCTQFSCCFSDETQESLAEQARMAGADVVGGEELIAKVTTVLVRLSVCLSVCL